MLMSNLYKDKRGVTGGLVNGLVFGIAFLVIGVIISLLVVSILVNSGILTSGTAEYAAVTNLSSNFTSGINQVSAKIPTVFIIAAIVLILAVLAVLIAVWQRMKLGGGGASVI